LSEKTYFYSEIFDSIQGEGHYTGVPTAWLRFFLCNLQCNGFGQKEPTKPETYELPYQELDVSQYKTMEELPVFEFGCDSSYSWSKKFKSLNQKGSPSELAEKIRQCMISPYNPQGKFNHNFANRHMCFTGGEPLMKHAQACSVDIMKTFQEERDLPHSVTYETNGTQALTQPFIDYYKEYRDIWGGELFLSVSPKLWSVAGEEAKRAIRPDIVSTYLEVCHKGQLKFVINGTDESWAELDDVLNQFRFHGVDWPVWIMPAGATVEGQKLCDADVATEAFKRGFNVSARVHTYLWGNKIGV
jgi:7-carboxy-7-deazaguanine synthase